jgi:hypothetical protein
LTQRRWKQQHPVNSGQEMTMIVKAILMPCTPYTKYPRQGPNMTQIPHHVLKTHHRVVQKRCTPWLTAPTSKRCAWRGRRSRRRTELPCWLSFEGPLPNVPDQGRPVQAEGCGAKEGKCGGQFVGGVKGQQHQGDWLVVGGGHRG